MPIPRVHYSERSASPLLEHQVLSYWELGVRGAEPFVHRVFPDGCVGLVYQRNEHSGTSSVRIGGGRLHALTVPMHGGDRYWGVRLSPAACALWLGADPAVLRGKDAPLLGSALLRRLDAADDFASAIAAFDAHLHERNIVREQVDAAVARAVQVIDARAGQLRMSELAASLGLCARQLQRRFRAATGLTPKQFARTRRLRALALKLARAEHASWSARAQQLGFADQAHLTRELVALTGRAPVSFANALAEIAHGELVR